MNKLFLIVTGLAIALSSCVNEEDVNEEEVFIEDIKITSRIEPAVVSVTSNTREFTYYLSSEWIESQNIQVGKKYHKKTFSVNPDSYTDYVEFKLVELEPCEMFGGHEVIIGYFVPLSSSSFSRLELEKVIYMNGVINPNNGQPMSVGEHCLFQAVWGNGYSPVYDISDEEYLKFLGVEPMSSI